MKKRKVTRKKRFQQVGTIGIVSVFLAIVLIIIGNFQNGDKENISKADYSAVKIGITNFGDEYGLLKVPASEVNNKSSPKQDIMTVSSSFYNYRYDHEIEKGWRDQGIAGELSGVGNPFGKFNDKLSEYYKTDNGTTPFGLYVGNFYNHWKGSYNAKNYQWCIDNYSGFTWAQNIANRDKYNAVCQGLVGTSTDSTKKDLVGYEWTKDSFKPGTIMCSNGTTPLPFFNKKFLTPNDINASEHTDDTSVDIGVVAENVGFPFRYAHDSQKGSYYVFDSKYDVVSFDGSESDDCKDAAETYQYYYGKKHQSDSLDEKPTLNYYYQKNQVHTRQNKNPQFLPFNGTNANGDPAKLDFGFGMRVDIPFYLTEDGKQLAADGGNPMKFNFEGDDDVWVFIDGELVLDLGGAHAKTKGSIDFSTSGNYVTVRAETVSYLKNGKTTAGTNCFENDGDNTDVKDTNDKVPVEKGAVHVLTIFYMERGMIESNLYMDFNFIPHNEEIGAPSTGDNVKTDSELTVTTKIDSDKVAGNDNDPNSFKSKVKQLAEDDAFRYKIENAGTGTGNVQDSGIKYPSGVLSVRENEGKKTFWSYGSAPDVKVYFDALGVQGKKANNRNYYWGSDQAPHITIGGKLQEPAMKLYKEITTENKEKQRIYVAELPFGTKFKFKNQENDGYQSDSEFTADDTTAGKVYSVTTMEDSGDLRGTFSSDVCYDAIGISDHSLNLPYQTIGSVYNFSPSQDNTTEYKPVSNTSYKLTEYYLAATETYDKENCDKDILNNSTVIQIFKDKNNSITSGKTSDDKEDNKGIFSLLNEDSATFLKQFRMNSNMRIVQQDTLGKVNRTPPPSKSKKPDLYKSATGGNEWVSQITAGSRKTKDFYYTKVSAENTIPNLIKREVTVSKTGEFKFANVKKDGEADFTSNDKITINETFNNQVKTGNLCISKEITGMKENVEDTEYTFTIKFKDVFGVDDGGDYTVFALDYDKYDKAGDKIKANDTDEDTVPSGQLNATTPTVTLKQGEKIIIKGIPVGTKYQIIETNTIDAVAGKISVSYDTKVNGKTQMTADSGTEITTLETGQTGTIKGEIPTSVTNSSTSETFNEFEEVDVNVTFTNQKGVLRIEKLAIGEWQNFKNEEYTFTITEDDSSINSYKYDVYEYNKETGESQIAKSKNGDELKDISITDGKIKLKATQWALIQDIPLTESGKTYTIKETAGNYYKINNIDLNAGSCTTNTVAPNGTSGTISVQLSWTKPEADVTFVNRYDPAYITINKYVDALYYQIYEDGNVTDKNYSDVTDDEITYQHLTNAKQSFVFNIEEYDSIEDATNQKNKISTFQVTIPINSNNKLSSKVSENSKDYWYQNSKMIKLTLGRVYRISEDENWSWKYDFQRIGIDFDNTTGQVHTPEAKYIIFEGGSKTGGKDIPVINFYNTLTEDQTKLSTDGDTDVVVNIIKPDD